VNSRPLVSIITTTKNEEKNIENCLQSMFAQTYQNIEIIVVDNFSTDRTREIALKYTENVFQKGPERSAQRNYGMIEMAKGKYVMFVDTDMILSPSLIAACVDFIESEDCPALHIPEIVLGGNFFSRVRRFERTFYDGTVIDGARFFLKEAFCKVDGFDESMSGPEDWDIDKKIKQLGKIKLLPALHSETVSNPFEPFLQDRGVNPSAYGPSIFHNEAEFELQSYLKKKGYYSTSFDTYIKKWGPEDPDIRKQFGLGYRFLGVFVEGGKWRKLIRRPVLMTGMYLLRFLVGVMFLTRKREPEPRIT
jgi:glycosyltransferase involved in cell wall biosynthesis